MPQLPILFLLISFGSISAVLFTPALPTIQDFFHLTEAGTQLTVTSFLIGYAVGQLPYGPISNGMGRKKALYIGLSISVFASLLCALAAPLNSFPLLVIARFIQALGACVGLKVSFTMIADSYDQTTTTKKIAILMTAFAVMPGIGVAIGGWITELLNWESCFYFLALFGLLNLFLATRLPETAKALDPNACHLSDVIQNYLKKIRNQQLVFSGLIMGCGTAVVYLYASKAPFIGIQGMGLNPDTFGVLNLIPSAGMLAGAIFASRLAGHFTILNLLKVGISSAFILTFTMIIPFLIAPPNIWSLFCPIALIYIAATTVFTHSLSFGLSTVTNKSNGSAMIQFINLGTSFIIVLTSQFIYPTQPIVLPISFAILFLTMWILLTRLKKIIHY